ncbi:MAG: hypothetical protein HYY20_06125 [Candidatus Tectomicrobia bacterium]|uniref:Carbon monoxide dehydrogenase n=1 Tax=Tectimicrobiota bacterium TaxID=2528274 RepID=A0A932CN37_UNCTE|nr:hypothetical protein [Candidatus Tectomicrobia bacterium]
MLIEESFTVKKEIEGVWAFLRDIERASRCIPGCDGIEILDGRTFYVTVRAKVSYIPVTFRVKTVVEEETPPTRLSSTSKGEEKSKAGYLSQKNTLELRALSANETEICYRSEVSITGRLATFGQRVIQAKSRELAEEFAQNLKAQLEGTAEFPAEEVRSGQGRGVLGRLLAWIRGLWRRLSHRG